MRTILIHVPGHGDGRLFDPAARDSVNEPFIHLRDQLAARGYALETTDERSLEGCERLILWDFPPGMVRPSALRRVGGSLRRRLRRAATPPRLRPLYSEAIEAGMRARMLLCTGEPPVVLPSNWKPATHSRFDTILTWNDRYAGSGKYRKFCWPVTQRSPHVEPVPFGRKKLLVNISANKRSDHPQDLYRERRAAIRHFERAAPEEFDLYGVGWDSPGEPPYPSYRGAIPDKSTVLRRYRFALCYENMRDEPGWVTEKIFDCMRADCVPIYWGAPNVNAYVDPAAFVDRRRFATDRELERFLRAMSEADYERHRAAIRAYLAGTDFARFLSPAFAGTVIGALGLGD